jgi:transcription elongation factor Elf1
MYPVTIRRTDDMAKTQCSNCGASLSPETPKCPECGNLQSSRPRMAIGAAGVLIAALAIVLGAIYVIARDEPANPAGSTTEIRP